MGEKLTILKLRKEGKLISEIGQILGVTNTKIWNVLIKNKTSGVLIIRQDGQGKHKLLTRETLRGVKMTPKTVRDINNLHCEGVKVSQSTVSRRLREKKYLPDHKMQTTEH